MIDKAGWLMNTKVPRSTDLDDSICSNAKEKLERYRALKHQIEVILQERTSLLQAVKEELRNGTYTTGDRIRDYFTVQWGDPEDGPEMKQALERLFEVQRKVHDHVGRTILGTPVLVEHVTYEEVVKRIHAHSIMDPGMFSKHKVHHLALGILNRPELVVDVANGKIDLPVSEYARYPDTFLADLSPSLFASSKEQMTPGEAYLRSCIKPGTTWTAYVGLAEIAQWINSKDAPWNAVEILTNLAEKIGIRDIIGVTAQISQS